MSEDPKYKPDDVSTEQVKEKVNIKRYLNLGKEIELSFGKFNVKEPDLYTIITLITDSYDIFMELGSGKSPLQMLTYLAKDEEARVQTSKIMASLCGSDDYEPFYSIHLQDFVKVLIAVKEVVDFEELQKSFLELGLLQYLTPPTSTETSETLNQ